MALLGTLGVGWSVYDKLTSGTPLFLRASVSILIFTLGSMFLLFAMLFDMQANEGMEVQVYE
jgi:hypothetical protein